MYKRLQELGIPAVITRDTDRTLTRQERIGTALNAFGKNTDVILISNHINAGGGEGAEIVYALRNTPALAQMAINNIGSAGQKIRKIYQRRLPENPSQDYYYIIRDTNPLQSMLVEYGFIDNVNDANKLKNNLNNYVEGVVKAIADYSNVPYKVPGSSISDSDSLYMVQRGDTLYKIANLFNTTVSELKRLNNLTSDLLTVGQELLISEPSVLDSDFITYTVKPGDSLSKIATLYDTDISTIKNLNNLTSNVIIIGQELKLPKQMNNNDSGTYQVYTVQRGDSLWAIANKFKTTVDDIISLNNLSSINLQVGDMLKIPTSLGNSSNNIGNDSINNMDTMIYTVKSGDTLWSIARLFNISVDELKLINNLTSNLLSIGQSLMVPIK
ncbi:MAG: LysM peptidoglycan-binding domain-containing protein [Bacilli bacterium]|nr:LysM peptidoglycan-binding domain-containing protein [Bacilli bacterium]